jgi:mitochondrial fission protein ELM1
MAGAAIHCWVMSDGRAGMEIQCLGLAEALGLDPVVKRVAGRRPLRWFTPWLRPGALWNLRRSSSPLEPPWPDLIVASGRQPIAPALKIRQLARRQGQRVHLVQIQDPAFDPRRFDVIVAPKHDPLRGPNVVFTLGSMHRVTPARLAEAGRRFAGEVTALPRPLVGVLLGGNSRVHRFTAARAAALGGELASLARSSGAGLWITASRRTPPEILAALLAPLGGLPHRVWDGQGENPYFGILALADLLVVTEDSVNMTSEAVAAGRPVLVAPLEGGSDKFAAFHAEMRARGFTRPFAGRCEIWTQQPFDEPGAVAAEIRRRIALPW